MLSGWVRKQTLPDRSHGTGDGLVPGHVPAALDAVRAERHGEMAQEGRRVGLDILAAHARYHEAPVGLVALAADDQRRRFSTSPFLGGGPLKAAVQQRRP